MADTLQQRPVPKTDLDKLAARSDLGRLADALEDVTAEDLERALRALKRDRRPAEVPPVDGDFYDVFATFGEDERRLQRSVRRFFADHVRPVINDYWDRGEFPKEIIPKVAALVEELYGPLPARHVPETFALDVVRTRLRRPVRVDLFRGALGLVHGHD